VRLNEKRVGHNRPKSTQGGDKSQLPDFFSQIEIKFDTAEMFLPMSPGQIPLNRELERPERDENYDHEKSARHNSLP
jgi:hypothetical protein